MGAQILRGSKREIAESVARIPGEVREAIVFVEEPWGVMEDSAHELFSSMEPFAAHAGGADYSREALYSGTEDECSLSMLSISDDSRSPSLPRRRFEATGE